MEHSIVSLAREFAAEAHKNQSYGGHPYSFHLAQVAMIVAEVAPLDMTLRAASYLHDVLEDTKITYLELQSRFGTEISGLVAAVTDEPGMNRKEKKSKTYPKIALAGYKAATLKYADRIANVRHSKVLNPDLYKMYKREWPEFQQKLGGIGDRKLELELTKLMTS